MRLFFAEYLSGLVREPLEADWLVQGEAMRNAVLADLLACRVAGQPLQLSCAAMPRSPLPAALGAARVLAPEPGESPFGFVHRQAMVHDVVWLIAPETGDVLGELSERVPSSRWLGCDSDSIRVATSKSRTTALLQGAGLLTPQAFQDDPQVAAWVVKPDDGTGATDARRHTARAAAEADVAQRVAARRPSVLEPWVEGPAMSLSLLCDGGHAELLSVNRQAIGIDAGGWLQEQGVQPLAEEPGPSRAALEPLVQRLARAMPGLFGHVGVDFVWHAGRGPVFIEVNPRVTSAYVGLAARSPRNLAQSALDLWIRRASR